FYLDFRGNGRSQRLPPAHFSLAAVVDDVEAMRQALGLGQIALLGHSFGGFVALSYALAHPERVSHLISSCSAPSHDFRRESQALVGPFLVSHSHRSVPAALPTNDPDDAALRRLMFQWLPLYFARYEAEIQRVVEDWATRTSYSSAIYSEWLTQ